MKQRTLFSLSLAATLNAAVAFAQMHHGGMGGQMPHGRMMGILPPAMESPANPITPAKVELGRMLYYDPRLSQDGTVSCNSCHDLQRYGVDGKRFSSGVRGQLGGRNSPSVYNAAGHIAQFWDGRAVDVEEQAKGPILNPVEMAMPAENDVIGRIQAIRAYEPYFRKAFAESTNLVTLDNIALAIGAFERKLVTPSRWDKFLAGKRDAITSEEMRGHHEFMHGGCATCHNGPYVGGGMFQKLGAKAAWPSTVDPGRFAVTKAESDRMVFKVPSLRNVAKTGPYFHDGSVDNLDETVRLMASHQLGVTLAPEQIKQIVAWLNTLTGELPSDYIKAPKLPSQ